MHPTLLKGSKGPECTFKPPFSSRRLLRFLLSHSKSFLSKDFLSRTSNRRRKKLIEFPPTEEEKKIFSLSSEQKERERESARINFHQGHANKQTSEATQENFFVVVFALTQFASVRCFLRGREKATMKDKICDA